MLYGSKSVQFCKHPFLFAALLLNSTTTTPVKGSDPNVDVGVSLPAAQQQPTIIDPTWDDNSPQGPCRFVTNNNSVSPAVVSLNNKTEWLSWITPTTPPTTTQFSAPAASTQSVCCRPRQDQCVSSYPGYYGAPVSQSSPDLVYSLAGTKATTYANCNNSSVLGSKDGQVTVSYNEINNWQCVSNNSNPHDGVWRLNSHNCCSNHIFSGQECNSPDCLGSYQYEDGCGNLVTAQDSPLPAPCPLPSQDP